METGTRPTIVVGVSGSPASAGALRWAASEARRRGADLRVVLCWNDEPRAYYAPPRGGRADSRQQHSQQLATMVRQLLNGTSPHVLTTKVVEGAAERTLIDESAGADLLVLGATPSGRSGAAIGPVIRACLSSARCPVVVVGADDWSGRDPRGCHRRQSAAAVLAAASPARHDRLPACATVE
jgi:nucleotide-binding universal stress UspA family protein